jgi:hypothetical protein
MGNVLLPEDGRYWHEASTQIGLLRGDTARAYFLK